MTDTTDWQAEADAMRRACDEARAELAKVRDGSEVARAASRSVGAAVRRTRDERKAARLGAQREVGETVRKLREERDAALAAKDLDTNSTALRSPSTSPG